MKMRRIAAIAIAALVVAACADVNLVADNEESTPSTPVLDQVRPGGEDEGAIDDAEVPTPDEGVNENPESGSTSSTVDPSPPRPLPSVEPVDEGDASMVTGEVPDNLMQTVVADAEERTGLDRASMAILRSEQVQWPDGSLGCPEPGVVYTMAIVDGYWVEIRVGDATLDYRIDDRGFFRLCESSAATGAVSPREPILPADDSRIPDPGDDAGGGTGGAPDA